MKAPAAFMFSIQCFWGQLASRIPFSLENIAGMHELLESGPVSARASAASAWVLFHFDGLCVKQHVALLFPRVSG